MTEQKIVELLIQNSEKGISIVIETYSPLVYAIVSRVILSVGTKEDVQECISDVFVAIHNSRESIDLEKGSLKSYIATTSKNQAINFYRKLKKQVQSHTDLEPLENVLCTSDDFLSRENQSFVVNAVKQLGEPDTTIIIQKFFFGSTAKQIAPKVNLSAEAVQKRASRAIEKLKIILGGVEIAI